MSDEDYNEIRKTLASYSRAADAHDSDAYSALFTDDALLVSRTVMHRGRPAIKKFLINLFKDRPEEQIQRHLFGNNVIRINGDTADVESDMVVIECLKESSWQVKTIVRHSDRMKRQPDGRWLFAVKHMAGTYFIRSARGNAILQSS